MPYLISLKLQEFVSTEKDIGSLFKLRIDPEMNGKIVKTGNYFPSLTQPATEINLAIRLEIGRKYRI